MQYWGRNLCACTSRRMESQRRSMEAEHSSIGIDDAGCCASVIALLLAARILEAEN